jgi:RimJ/RimL family protein N-acetyltransferase
LIRTERLLLRRPRLDDVDGVLEHFSDPVAMEFIGEPTSDRAAALAAIERWLARWDADGFGFLAVERRDDGCFLGRVGILVWDTRTWQASTLAEAGAAGQVELGWSFSRAHWGRGYATEAARAARAWAFEEARITSLISLIHPDNVRSIRVAEKLGARPTSTVRAHGKPAVVWRHPRPGRSPDRPVPDPGQTPRR